MLIAGALALILPTSFGMGLLPALGYLMTIIFNIFRYIFLLILIPIAFVISLFQGVAGEQPLAPVKKIISTAPDQLLPENATGIAWVEFIQSIFFWFLFIGLISYVIYQYFNQNRELITRIKSVPVIRLLIKAWLWLKSRLSRGYKVIPTIFKQSLKKLGKAGTDKNSPKQWQSIRIRKLSPRDRVLFWYLALLRRGREYGFSRRPDQTPYNYADAVSSQISDVGDEIKLITEAFVEARYSLHEITEENAGFVRRYWEIIRRKLRQLRKV
jgi:hypothetical protein